MESVQSYKQVAAIYGKVAIFTSEGIDGYIGGGVCVKMLTEIFGFHIDNITVFHREYDKPFKDIEKYKFVIVSDLPVVNDEDAKTLIKFNSDKDTTLLWFDHHQTSILMSKKHHELNRILGARSLDAAAAMIAYAMYMHLRRGEEVCSFADVKSAISSDYTPKAVKYADDYNRAKYVLARSEHFIRAFEMEPTFPKDCKSKELLSLLNVEEPDILHWFLTRGEKYNRVRSLMAINTILEEAFIGSISKFPYLEMLCVNTLYKSELDFNKLYRKYNFLCLYSIKNNEYEVNIYKQSNETGVPTANEIAEAYGGGGNTQSAEFVTDSLKFMNTSPLTDSDRAYLSDIISEKLRYLR